MDKRKESPFVAPDVIALLCRDNINPNIMNKESKTTKNVSPKGEQKEFDRSLQRRNSCNTEHPPAEHYGSQNSLPVDHTAWPKYNNKKKYNNRSHSRSSFHYGTESYPADQANNKHGTKGRGKQKYFKEGQCYVGDKYYGHEHGRNQNWKQSHQNLNEGNCTQTPQQKLIEEKSASKESANNKNSFDHDLKKDKCPDLILSGDKICDQTSREKNTSNSESRDKQPVNSEKGESLILRVNTEISRAVENFVAANVTGSQNNNTGAIPKSTSVLYPMNSLIAKNLSDRSAKVSLDSSKSKLSVLVMQHHFVDNVEAIKSFVQDNYTKETVGEVVKEAFEIMLKKNTQSRERIGILISELMGCGLITNMHVTDVLCKLYTNSVGTTDDCPLPWIWIAEFIIPMIRSNCLSFLDLQNAGKPFLKTKFAKHLLIPVFNKLIGYENLHGLYEQKLTSSEEIQKQVQKNLKSFMERREHLEHALQFIMESIACVQDVFVSSETNNLLQNIFSPDNIKDEASANYIALTLSDMFEFGFIQPDVAARHLNTIFDGDSVKNNPLVLQMLAHIFANLVVCEQFQMQHVVTATLPILKTPQALDFFLKLFNILKENFGDQSFQMWLKSSRISVYDLVDRYHVKDLVQHLGLHDLDLHSSVGQPLSALNIQQELVEMIKNREKVDDIKDWISVHTGSRTKDQAFIRDLTSAVCEGSLNNGLDADAFNEYKKLISNYTKTDDKEMSTLFMLLKLVTRDHKGSNEEKESAESSKSHRLEQVTIEKKTSDNPPQVIQNQDKVNPLFYNLLKAKEHNSEDQVAVKNTLKNLEGCTETHKPTPTKKIEGNMNSTSSDTIPSPEKVQSVKNKDLTVKVAAENTQQEKISKELKEKAEPSSANNQKEDSALIGSKSLEEIQINVIESIKKGTHFRCIKQFIDENLAEDNKGACLMKILTNCIIQTSFNEDTFKADNMQYYGKLLRLCIDGNRTHEIVVLRAVQDFIEVRTEFKDYIRNTFHIFLTEEIISKEAFLEFMDSKIKGDVLSCLTTFYNTLTED